MYDFFEFGPIDKKTAAGVLGVFILLVVTGGIGYMLGIRNAGTGTGGENIYDNGNAAQHVREEIGAAGSDIGAAKSGIDNAAAAAGRIEERISDAQERAEYVKGTADEGRRIVAECKSVLREVRAGGQAGKVKD